MKQKLVKHPAWGYRTNKQFLSHQSSLKDCVLITTHYLWEPKLKPDIYNLEKNKYLLHLSHVEMIISDITLNMTFQNEC